MICSTLCFFFIAVLRVYRRTNFSACPVFGAQTRISAGLYLVEFFADKIPWIDSIWDAVHTFIRPLGVCLLALETLGDASPLLKTVGVLIAGGSSLTTHTAKAATRAVANVSPEPVSNVALSLVEDATVAGGTAIMFLFPTIMLVLCVLVIAALWLVLPRLFRRIGGFFRILKLKIFGLRTHAKLEPYRA